MPVDSAKDIVDVVAAMCNEAVQKLMIEGFSVRDAKEKVQLNLLRINSDPRAIATIQELCK